MRDRRELLRTRISDLPLQIPGTGLEKKIKNLYRELDAAGIMFKPRTYLSDEWGCPHAVPVIGIPFYLADPELCDLECRATGIAVESGNEVMFYLRHESGHAFNYAYRLYDRRDWGRVFGDFSLPYREKYRPSPFSTSFVRNVPGWYAQKHPDDDFAETFAVWLTPDSDWRRRYSGTPALKKLLYVDKIVNRYGDKAPAVTDIRLDRPVAELTMTLEDWYGHNKSHPDGPVDLPGIIEEDLRRLFAGKSGESAASLLEAQKGRILQDVNNWVGIERHVLGALIDNIINKTQKMELKIPRGMQTERIVSFTSFITTLAANYQSHGVFIQ